MGGPRQQPDPPAAVTFAFSPGCEADLKPPPLLLKATLKMADRLRGKPEVPPATPAGGGDADQPLVPGLKPDFNSDLNSERPLRSIVKSISWRVIGTLDTVLISWLVTGEVTLALSIGSIELFTKMFLYFLHERLWNAMRWGRDA